MCALTETMVEPALTARMRGPAGLAADHAVVNYLVHLLSDISRGCEPDVCRVDGGSVGRAQVHDACSCLFYRFSITTLLPPSLASSKPQYQKERKKKRRKKTEKKPREKRWMKKEKKDLRKYQIIGNLINGAGGV